MSEILSKSISTSVLPVAQGAASATAAPAGPARPDAAMGAADFLGQLKTALKNLTKAVTQTNLTSEPAPWIAAAQAPGAEAAPARADLKDAKRVDHKSDPVPDVLAALGLVPVPIAFVPLAAPAEKTAAATPQLPLLPKSAQPDVPQPPPGAPRVANDAVQLQAQLELSKLPKPQVHLPMPEVQPTAVAPSQAPRATTLVAAATTADASLPTAPTASTAPTAQPALTAATAATAATAPSAPTAPTAPTAQPVPTDPATLAPTASAAGPQAAAPLHHAVAPTATADAAQVIGSQQTAQQHLQQDAFQQSGADDGRQPTSKKATRVDDTVSAPSVTAAGDSASAAAAGSTVSNSGTLLPPHVRPAEVVSQIAHQADLYRLPGNRGVRIQLHPEGLGGVEVTLRYGVGGAVQLHINVEHAATSALVQAGWSQLRDALATQGISPDRLVMSITAPNGSSQLDFSGGGSGRQTDPGTTGFAHSQAGQQRQDDPEQTSTRGWNGAIEPTSPSDDSPRVAPTTAATSRIDYRA